MTTFTVEEFEKLSPPLVEEESLADRLTEICIFIYNALDLSEKHKDETREKLQEIQAVVENFFIKTKIEVENIQEHLEVIARMLKDKLQTSPYDNAHKVTKFILAKIGSLQEKEINEIYATFFESLDKVDAKVKKLQEIYKKPLYNWKDGYEKISGIYDTFFNERNQCNKSIQDCIGKSEQELTKVLNTVVKSEKTTKKTIKIVSDVTQLLKNQFNIDVNTNKYNHNKEFVDQLLKNIDTKLKEKSQENKSKEEKKEDAWDPEADPLSSGEEEGEEGETTYRLT